MSDAKHVDAVFDPKSGAGRYKLWVLTKTPAGESQFLILWRRVAFVFVALAIFAWLGLAGSLWAFVKYKRGVTDVRFVDIAFFPLRRDAYRETLARHHLATAKAQIEKQAWSDALLSLRVALGHAPRNLEIRRLLAELYLLFKRPELSRQVLEDGLPFAGDDAAYLRQTFGFLRSQRQHERIVTLGNQLLSSTPDLTFPHRVTALQVALACLQLKRFDDAETLITRWQLDRAPEGQALLADVAIARGLPELAIDRLKDQLARNPKSEAFAVQLTKLYLKLNRLDEARRVALMRSFAHPESPGAHIDLLNMEWQSGDHASFTREATRYLGNFSADANALLLLSILAADKAQPDLANQVLITARTAGHAPALFLFAVMQAQCAALRYADALQTSIELDKDEKIPFRSAAALPGLKAWAYFGLNNDAEGEVWLQRYLTQRQINPSDALRLATALGAMDKGKIQVRLLVALADLQPASDEAVIALANYYVQHNAWTEAGARLTQLRAVANPPDELIQTIQWHLTEDPALAPTLP